MKLQKFDLDHKLCYWWLRSNLFYSNCHVGYVDYYGYVSSISSYYNDGVLPACITV